MFKFGQSWCCEVMAVALAVCGALQHQLNENKSMRDLIFLLKLMMFSSTDYSQPGWSHLSM